ncbi:MAG: ATP-binding cassette domain-containing protein [Anaerolineales bacterium]|nr:ATP-binding cassette domain-containing protein [Anaerolineales bacterium]
MSDPILTTKDLRKTFGSVEAVRGVSFSVLRGEIFSLLGPNGAGKTTTISMLSCLLAPTGGTAVIDNHDILKDSLQVRQLIGVVPQEIALYEELTARQNLNFWGQMVNLGGKALQERIAEVLDQVNLADRADDRVSTFSGGMKRRINIAVGLLHKPKLLFMDEPTVGIDPQSRRRILDMVRELRAQGMTVLYTTHYMEEAEELSDRVGIIDHGRLIALGTQSELNTLVGQQETLRLHFAEGQHLDNPALFDDIPGVLHGTSLNGELALSVAAAAPVLPAVIAKASAAGLTVRTIDIEEPNLEAVFLHLTGRALRD